MNVAAAVQTYMMASQAGEQRVGVAGCYCTGLAARNPKLVVVRQPSKA
jgi:hypothetical protein